MEASVTDCGIAKNKADNANHDSKKENASDDMEQLAKLTAKISLKEQTECSSMNIPSKINDRKWLWAGSSEEYRRQDDPLGGKWLIFLKETDRDKDNLTTIDKAWALIEKATLENMFYQAKVSTAVKEPYATNDDFGVIVIYTKDFDDIEDINKNAKNIESVLNDYLIPKNFIRYKTNAATEARLYPSQNCKNVTNYQYSIKYGLQVRNGTCWVPVSTKNPIVKKPFNKPQSKKTK